MLGIIPLALGAVSAASSIIGGIGAASSKRKQQERIAQSIETQIETEKEVYKLQQDTRLWQQNEQRWQRVREKLDLANAKRQQVFDSRLRARQARVGKSQAVQGLRSQAFQVDQQRSMVEQQFGQQREQVGRQQQQTAREGQQALREIPGAGEVPLDSMQDLAALDRANLAREQIQAEVTNQNSMLSERVKQDQLYQGRLADMQQRLQAGSLGVQMGLVRRQKQTTGALERRTRQAARLETQATRRALRANALAERALYRNMSDAEKAEHRARVAQMSAQMPTSSGGGLQTIANVVGSLAPFAGQVAGTFMGSGSGGVQQQPAQQPVTPLSQPLMNLPNFMSQPSGGQAISSGYRPMNAGVPPYPGMPAPSAAPAPPYPGMTPRGGSLFSGFVPNNRG